VNLATKDTQYILAQERLRNSVASYSNEFNFISYVGEESVGAPKHHPYNYAFKVYAVDSVKHYDLVLWLDCSIVLVNSPKPVFDIIETQGFFAENSGHSVGMWCNDRTLEYFGITREEANKMRMFSSGMTGFNFKTDIGQEFFERWKQSMSDGMFTGSWKDHRHDQTCGSIILNQMGLADKYAECGTYFAYIGAAYSPPQETAIGHLLGV
jgi:hypothetical protein